ncbi:MAG: Fe-S cluster assembly protein SufD [Pseudomonadales bacterium]|nr:Fe-S cluster assembly protein SufD [Pseudomonadales bacterium]
MAGARVTTELEHDAPDWVDAQGLAELTSARLASHRSAELWKYSSLPRASAALAATPYGDAISISAADELTATRFSQLTHNARAQVRSCVRDAIDQARYPLSAIVALKAGDGWLLETPRDVNSRVHIEHSKGAGIVILRIADNASVNLLEEIALGDAGGCLLLIALGRNAHLRHTRVSRGAAPCAWQLTHVTAADSATYELCASSLGSTLERFDCHVQLAGAGASARLSGAALVDDKTHLDQQLVIEHAHPHTESTTRFHTLLRGKARSTFNGRIHIHPGAHGAAASLTNRNLALDEGAEVNTKPELEIYNDDVRCSHGATVGSLDDEAIFYLLSRGIDQERARQLLCEAFLSECLEESGSDTARDSLMEVLRRA